MLELEQAQFDVLLTPSGVQQRALITYWRWVTTGRQLQIYQELLELGKDREAGLKVQIRKGNLAQIYLTENRQNITRRQALAFSAERNYRAATNALAFYYQGGNGETRFVRAQRLPSEADLSGMLVTPMRPVSDSIEALKRCPELLKLKTAMERAQRRDELSENELKPRLGFSVELTSGLGSEGKGGPPHDTNDVIVGFTFLVPPERRYAKGRLAESEAESEVESELESLSQQRRELEDQLSVDLRNILLDLDVAKQLVDLANLEVEQSGKLRQAESGRFEQGASDFFLVNLREETAADARIRYFIAAVEKHIARANYEAATVNLQQLGLR